MTQEYVLGIDPGATGGLALYNVTKAAVAGVWNMPSIQQTLTTKKKTNRVEVKKLYNLMLNIETSVQEQNAKLYVHIEKVNAFGKQSAPAAFNFGKAVSVPNTIAILMGYTPLMLPPQTWKRPIGLQGSDKDESRLLAIELFPHLAETLKYKYTVDIADAIHIAMYKP